MVMSPVDSSGMDSIVAAPSETEYVHAIPSTVCVAAKSDAAITLKRNGRTCFMMTSHFLAQNTAFHISP